MDVALRGSSPRATIAAILLMTRARQLGLRIRVRLVGDPDEAAKMPGPVLVHSAVLASCGIGREHGTGSVVVLPGAPERLLLLSLDDNGVDHWFAVDRAGQGHHPATRAFVRLSHDPRVEARKLSKDLRRAMETLGMAPDPAVLDVLFGAPAPPLVRLALALRAGRAIARSHPEPITRYVSGQVDADHDPLPPGYDRAALTAALDEGGLAWIADGLASVIRDRAEAWVADARQLAREDGGRDLDLLAGLAEVASHLVVLTPNSMLPPLPAHGDAVASALGSALAASGDDEAYGQLRSVFQFLGGTYVADDPHAHDLGATPPPEEPSARWRWFCEEAVLGRARADALWPDLWNPPS